MFGFSLKSSRVLKTILFFVKLVIRTKSLNNTELVYIPCWLYIWRKAREIMRSHTIVIPSKKIVAKIEIEATIDRKLLKELCFRQKLKFSNPYFFATGWLKLLIF